MRLEVETLMQSEFFSPLDRHFARFIAELSGGEEGAIAAAALLASSQTSRGHVCADLSAFAGKAPGEALGEMPAGDQAGAGPPFPRIEDWMESLRRSAAVGKPGDYRPLVLDEHGRLYLYRYWRYEQELIGIIEERTAGPREDLDLSLLKEGIARLFPDSSEKPDRRRLAALAAVTRRFTVISGGPGTGKTTLVAAILALFLEQARVRKQRFRAALAAPTGKAAARLQSTMRAVLPSLACDDEIKRLFPAETFTVHRLLGAIAGSPYFRHDEGNPLPYDLVVVDESSMADLALMAKLARAVRREAPLILIGDKDQLASVEAGAVLGDICDTGAEHGFSGEFASLASSIAGVDIAAHPGVRRPAIGDSIMLLRRSYRFDSSSGIGALASAIREGDAGRALEILEGGNHPDIAFCELRDRRSIRERLTSIIDERREAFLRAASPEEALSFLNRSVILCALRSGPLGVEGINDFIEKGLAGRGLRGTGGRFYAGRPIMITRNDYELRLFNGDTGLVLEDGALGLRAFFPGEQGGPRSIPTVRLPLHETMYAASVHKSQGSEFDRVVLVLPPHGGPLITRELLYTAVTRARGTVELWGSREVIRAAVENPVRRFSGLREALWERGIEKPREE